MSSFVVVGYALDKEGVPNEDRAGVVGLTTALVLARKGYKVTVVAKYMPGDLSIEYASPWAVPPSQAPS